MCTRTGDPENGTAREGVWLGTLNAQHLLFPTPIFTNRTSLGSGPWCLSTAPSHDCDPGSLRPEHLPKPTSLTRVKADWD